jgi:hypothetical protein
MREGAACVSEMNLLAFREQAKSHVHLLEMRIAREYVVDTQSPHYRKRREVDE